MFRHKKLALIYGLFFLCLVGIGNAGHAQANRPAYEIYPTNKSINLIVGTATMQQIYLHDGKRLYSLARNPNGLWQLNHTTQTEADYVMAYYPAQAMKFTAGMTIYLRMGKENFRLLPSNGGYQQSPPLQDKVFSFIIGKPGKKLENPNPPPQQPAPSASPAASPPKQKTTASTAPAPKKDDNLRCRPEWSSAAINNESFGGMFYGVAVAGEGLSYTPRFQHQASIRFRAEHTGTADEVILYNRVTQSGTEWNNILQKFKTPEAAVQYMRDSGVHSGDGGKIHIEIRNDNGAGLPANTVLATGTRDYKPVGGHPDKVGTIDGKDYFTGKSFEPMPNIKLDRLVSLDAGKLYHIVLNQVEPATGDVSMAGAYSTQLQNPIGGPYYGCSHRILWRNSAQETWKSDTHLLPLYAVKYTDGSTTGQMMVGNNATEMPINGPQLVRQNFTMLTAPRRVDGFYIRLRRHVGTNPLYISFFENRKQLFTINQPSEKVPLSTGVKTNVNVPWIFVALPKTIELKTGSTYTVSFTTDVTTQYYIGVSEPLNQTLREIKNVWGAKGSQAQNSTDGGRTWLDWSTSGASISQVGTSRPNADLPILFTTEYTPKKLN